MADELDDRDLKNTLNAWRESVDKHAERPDWFWARQRALVSSRMQGSGGRRFPALAWAGIAATIAVGAALMVPGSQVSHVDPAAKHPQILPAAPISDHELMQGLEETMNSGVPDALQPASTLEQAMEQAYPAKSTRKVKESRQ
jgi:hypothetical protein